MSGICSEHQGHDENCRLCNALPRPMPEPLTREQIYEEFRAGNTDESNFGAVLVDEMADEILRLRATLAQRREGVRACERCKGTGWACEYFTSGPQSGGVRYVACGCGTRGAVIANEYTKASATEGVTGAMVDTLHAAASDLRFVANGGVCERDTLLAHAHELLALAASGDSALGARDGGAA